jgi:putative restriction endonuclease
MIGFIAVTDHEWFEFLASIAPLDEVNFWRPSDTRTPRQLEVGPPVHLKRGQRIDGRSVGYGVLSHHDVFPAWLAWDNFDVKNGARTFAEMRSRIESLRSDAPEASQSVAGDYQIGCLMLAEKEFKHAS